MAGLMDGYDAAATFGFAACDPEASRTAATDTVPALAARSATTFSLVRDLEGLEGLEAKWIELFERSGRPEQMFQTFAWNWHWARTYLPQGRTKQGTSPIAILVGHSGGRLVTLWPMVLQRRDLLRELSWMGEPVTQYGDVLIDHRVADRVGLLRAGWSYMLAELQPDVARLRKVRADANFAPLLENLGTFRTAELEAPYIDLTRSADFAAYEQRFAKRAIRNRQRQRRRLEEAGTVVFSHLDAGAEASSFASAGIEMKRRWLIDRGHVSPALADTRMAAFMAAIAAAGSHSAGTRVSVLQSGGNTAAIQIGFTAKNTRLLHVIAYDRAYDKMAAGVLHLEEAIRRGFDEGLSRIDLLAPKAHYKAEWADGAVGVADHAIGLSLAGKVYARVYLGFARERLKALIEHLAHTTPSLLAASHLKGAARRMLGRIRTGLKLEA